MGINVILHLRRRGNFSVGVVLRGVNMKAGGHKLCICTKKLCAPVKGFWHDEDGATTITMVVSLLVALALLFTSAQTYRVNSASADIQEVADVAALAAENEIAEFMVAVRVCDAVVLSLSLLGGAVYGLGIVALCIPFTTALSEQLIEFGSKIFEARNTFASNAAKGLNALQKVLPFLSAANAASIGAANNAGTAGASYFAAAVLVPATGKDISVGDASDDTAELEQAVDEKADDVREKTAEVEQALEEANEAKQRGFERDCGDNPAYCMYERAAKLAGLSDAENPLYQSVDTWSFSVALKRAQSYYAARYAAETPDASASVEDQADSVLRKRFYAYAVDELSRGYVNETQDSFEALFPELYCNTEQMRETSLYTEAIYPITSSDGKQTMHAWSGCPEAAGATSVGSIRDLDEGEFTTCASCKFTVSSLGKVPAASTSISNGFEYHYAAVVEAARDYEAARAVADPLTAEVKDEVGSLLDTCMSTLKKLGSQRIDATPPGYKGAIALVVNTGDLLTDRGFESLFVSAENTLGVRAAVSGSTLLEDSAHDGSSVITSLLDGFGQDAGAVVGAARVVLDCWSGLLSAYAKGQSALTDAIKNALDWIPLSSVSGLGTWAAQALESLIETVGLQPADLDALKPVLVNTSHIASADDTTFSVTYQSVQNAALSMSSSSTGLFSSLSEFVDSTAGDILSKIEDGIEIAVVEFPIGDITLPITLTLPSAITDSTKGLVEQCVEAISSLSETILGVKEWS